MLRDLVRKGLFHVLAANALTQAVGFVVLLLLPRFVDPDTFAGIRVLQTVGDVLVLVAGFGYNTAVLVLGSTDTPSERAEGILHAAVHRTLAASAVAWLLALAFYASGIFDGTLLIGRWLPLYAVSGPFVALVFLLAAWMQARSRLREMARLQTLVRIQSAVVVLGATWAWGLTGFVGGTIAASVTGLVVLLRGASLSFVRVAPVVPEALDRIAGQSVAANVFQVAGRQADLLVLGAFAAGTGSPGPYAMATVLVIPVFVFSGAVQATCLPGFSARKGDSGWLLPAVDRLQGQTILAAALVALVIRLAAPFVLSALYSSAYSDALPFLDILLIHAVLRSGVCVYGAGQIAIGRTDLNAAASLFSAVAGIAAGILGLSIGGFVGLAWAQVAVSATLVPLYVWLFRAGLRRRPPDG